MAWIEKRKSGPLVRWREGTTIRSEKAPDLPAAKARKAEIELEQSRGTYIARDVRLQPFEDYARVLVEDPALEASTRYSYEKMLSKWVYPELGRLAIGNITTADLRRAMSKMAERGATPSILQKTRMILSKVFSQALREGVVNRNPVAGTKAPKVERREIVVLEPSQVAAIANAIRPRYKAAVLLAAWGTLRIGEIGALRRDDLDFERGVVWVRRAVSTSGAGVKIKEPKTRASRRTVALPPFVMLELKKHALQYADREGWLFRSEGGSLIHHQTMWPIWQEALDETGIEPRPRFHDLRHTAVAIMIREGAHPKVIQSRCGHSTITMTMDTYGHLFPGTDEELAATLERYAQ